MKSYETREKVKLTVGEFHDQGDNVRKHYYLSILTETTKYALRAAKPCAADRPARVWLPPNSRPFSVPLIMEFICYSASSEILFRSPTNPDLNRILRDSL
jgi:hypothetical protein